MNSLWPPNDDDVDEDFSALVDRFNNDEAMKPWRPVHAHDADEPIPAIRPPLQFSPLSVAPANFLASTNPNDGSLRLPRPVADHQETMTDPEPSLHRTPLFPSIQFDPLQRPMSPTEQDFLSYISTASKQYLTSPSSSLAPGVEISSLERFTEIHEEDGSHAAKLGDENSTKAQIISKVSQEPTMRLYSFATVNLIE